MAHDEFSVPLAGDSPATVTHAIDLDASLDDVWQAVTDPAQLAAWFGGEVDLEVKPAAAGRIVGDDGTEYAVLVTDVDDHRRVAWHWWDDQGSLSSVELTLEERDGVTRLRVVERLVESEPHGMPARAQACGRRWERATSRLWQRVSAHAGAR
jgi:uncharacterized protein YndB with AHSA1/START domain